MSGNSIEATPGGVVFSGPKAVNVYAYTVIASALDLYGKTGMKANRAYTPTAMLRAANEFTGKKFKRGQYFEAANAIRAKVAELRGEIAAEQREADNG